MIAFIGPSELTIAALVGLLLFGGKLPEVMRQVGRVWFGFRRSLNDLKRETGLEDALRDIRRETGGIRDVAKDFRQDMNPFTDSSSKWPSTESDEAEEVEVETTRKTWSSPTDTVADGDDLGEPGSGIGESAEVESTLDRMQMARERDPETGVINHANLFLLIDREGRLAYRLGLGERQQRWLVSALRVLLREES